MHMPHEKADARDRARTLINLEWRRYARRLKQLSEDYINEEYARITAEGGVFDHEVIAEAAVFEAQQQYMANELPAGDV